MTANEYIGPERRSYTPIEVRKISNGAKYGLIAALISLMGIAIGVVINIVIVARWSGRIETLLELQRVDTVEIKSHVRDQELRIDAIEKLDARMVQMLENHVDRDRR